jgi:hypothetical protein
MKFDRAWCVVPGRLPIQRMEALCRICYVEEGQNGQEEALCRPCRCRGSVGAVHESCLLQWMKGNQEERERCELCGTRYVFAYDRPTESVANAQRLCETIWGNIGVHIAFQYSLVICLTGTVSVRDILLLQVIYHGGFLLALARCIYRQLQSSVKTYMSHLLSMERCLYLAAYAGTWIIVLWGDYDHWFTIANVIAIQTYPPLFPYFHKMTFEDMNKRQRRVLQNWVQEGAREGVREIARGREEEI